MELQGLPSTVMTYCAQQWSRVGHLTLASPVKMTRRADDAFLLKMLQVCKIKKDGEMVILVYK